MNLDQNLDSLVEKVKVNFAEHISFAKDSDFFTRYSNDFFKDFDIDSPFLSNDDMLKIMTNKVTDSTPNKLDSLGINLDADSINSINKLFDKSENISDSIQVVKSKDKFKV